MVKRHKIPPLFQNSPCKHQISSSLNSSKVYKGYYSCYFMERKYDPEKFIGKYIERCEVAKQPLSKSQIGLLEQTVVEFFNFNESPTSQVLGLRDDNYNRLDSFLIGEISAYRHCKSPQRLINSIREYRYGKDANKEVEVTDGDALALYVLITDEMSSVDSLSTVNKKNGIKVGLKALGLLHAYIDSKGLLQGLPISRGIQELTSRAEA